MSVHCCNFVFASCKGTRIHLAFLLKVVVEANLLSTVSICALIAPRNMYIHNVNVVILRV